MRAEASFSEWLGASTLAEQRTRPPVCGEGARGHLTLPVCIRPALLAEAPAAWRQPGYRPLPVRVQRGRNLRQLWARWLCHRAALTYHQLAQRQTGGRESVRVFSTLLSLSHRLLEPRHTPATLVLRDDMHGYYLPAVITKVSQHTI